jgi:thymidylate kinase
LSQTSLFNDNGDGGRHVHRVVFTGGPCAGKTTSINRIKSFFENIGWKVFNVPETATFLLTSGIRFYDLDDDTRVAFQENLLKTLIQTENTINEVAKFYNSFHRKNCLIIYDRGAMDPVACNNLREH